MKTIFDTSAAAPDLPEKEVTALKTEMPKSSAKSDKFAVVCEGKTIGEASLIYDGKSGAFTLCF